MGRSPARGAGDRPFTSAAVEGSGHETTPDREWRCRGWRLAAKRLAR